ncbi:MAG: MlaD family protein, partial [Microvirga sp.]
METRANYALIGIFTLAIIAAAFGFVYWFSGGDRGQDKQTIRVVFSGSVSGISKGSLVLFNGLRVGEVTEINLLPDDPRRVFAIIQVDKSTPIRSDTRARLESQGLTGVAQIALTGGEPDAPPLTAGPGQPMPTIFADRSDFQDLLESARNIARRADGVLELVGRVVQDNEGAVTRTISNVERFSQALSENSPGIDKFLDQVGQAAERLGPLAEKLETLAANVDQLILSVDKQQVARVVQNVESFTQALGENREVISAALRDAAAAMRSLNEAGPKINTAVTDIGNIVRSVDPAKVGRAVDNVELFAQTLGNRRDDVDRIVRNVDSFTQALGENREVISAGLKDAAGAMRGLNEAGPKINTAVTDIGNIVRSVDPAKVGRAVDNVDLFAQTLGNRREDVDKIVRNVESFTQALGDNREVIDNTLKDAASLVRSLNEAGPKINAAITDFSNITRAVDPAKVGRSVDNIDLFTQTLGNRSGDVDRIIVEARSLSEKLNSSADKIDAVLQGAQNFLGSASGKEGQGTFEEIRAAAKSIRDLANNLNDRSAGVLSGFDRFSNSGLREYEALAVEGRRTLGDISRAVRSIERNPQQFIFGGQSS